jgi:hypothetical protein
MPPKWAPRDLLVVPTVFGNAQFPVAWEPEPPKGWDLELFHHRLATAIYQHHAAARISARMAAKGMGPMGLGLKTKHVLGEDGWRGVLNGTSLLRVEHLGAACVVLGGLVLPSLDVLQGEVDAHNQRVGRKGRKLPDFFTTEWVKETFLTF